MGSSKARSWVLGTVVVAFLLIVGTWFLAVSPQLAQAKATRDVTDGEIAQQDVLRVQLATLSKQFAEIETYRTELAAIHSQVPTTASLQAYLTELDTLAATSGVTLVGVTPGTPVSVVPPVAAPVAQPAESVTDDPAAAEVVPAEPAAPTSRLVAVQVSITAVGTYQNVTAFLQSLQTGASRLYLVTSLTATALDTSEAMAGRPATSPGDLEATVNGLIYVLPPQPVVDDGTVPEPVEPQPLPASDRNPFAPLAGG